MNNKKGLGGILVFCAVAATAAVATFFYLSKKDQQDELDLDEDFDDFDSTEEFSTGRRYVDLSLDGESVEPDDFEETPSESEEFFNEEAAPQGA